MLVDELTKGRKLEKLIQSLNQIESELFEYILEYCNISISEYCDIDISQY